MTNYEKYKDEFIELLAVSGGSCKRVFELRTNTENCPLYGARMDGDEE